MAPQLVQDPAGLLLGRRVVVAALEVGEAGQHASGERAVERQRHPGGQEGVAAEEGHEPRGPGGDDRPVRVCPVDDAQRRQVGQCLVHGSGQARVEGDHGGTAERQADSSRIGIPRASSAGRSRSAGTPAETGCTVTETMTSSRPAMRRCHPAVPRCGSIWSGSRVHHDLGAVLLVVRASECPPCPASCRSARAVPSAGGPAALDVEDVGEVGRELQLEVHADRQRVRVAQRQLLDQAARQPPPADDQDLRNIVASDPCGLLPGVAVHGRDDAGDDDGGQRCGRAGGQQLDPTARHRHAQPAQVAQVVVHQAVGGGDHVAGLVADREAAAVDGDEVVTSADGDRACREV